jgi:hypothetical protein
MKPEGRKPFKQHTSKHHIKGGKDQGWWCDVIEPNKAKARREAAKEMEQQLHEEEMERNKKLKPCKCGCTSLAVFSPAAHINYDYWVACDDCDMESDPFSTEEEAINNWNRKVG